MEELPRIGYKTHSEPRQGLNISLAVVIIILCIVIAASIGVVIATNRITTAVENRFERVNPEETSDP